MPILDLQRRHSTTFRLRIGEKVTSDGRTKPVRLTDSIRVTSATPAIVDAFVAQYGGERKPWEGQWEAKLPIRAIPITLLPGQSITAWWEHWAGATCARRCDGYEQTTGEACVCPSDIEARMIDRNACKPTTRLSVICPEVEVLGAGMLVTHGRIAAEELPSSVMVAEAALRSGAYVPATLVIEEMVGAGKRYVVPRIHITGTSLNQLQAGQVREAIEPAPAAALSEAETPALNAAPAAEPGPKAPARQSPPAGPAFSRGFAIACTEAGIEDDGRHALIAYATGGRVRSSKGVRKGSEAAACFAALERVKAETLTFTADDAGELVVEDKEAQT